MKTIILTIAIIIEACVSARSAGTNMLKPISSFIFPTNNADYIANTEANLTSFFPDVQLVNAAEMLKTNGLECWPEFPGGSFVEYDSIAKPLKVLVVPICFVSLLNHSTASIGCLRMPATNLCRIVLLDKQGQRVPKTMLGKTYGLPLSQEQIEQWRRSWNNRHQRVLIRIVPNGIPKYSDASTEICRVSLKDAFEITEPGAYELHLQLRLVQVGADTSGNLHYSVVWLPEVVTKVQIYQGYIPQNNPLRSTQTNALVK
jgi:hypothetical protein